MEQTQNLLSDELQMDSVIISHLKETAMWSKVTAVIGYFISALTIVFALYYGSLMSRASSVFSRSEMSGAVVSMVVIYILVGIIHLVLSILQYKFASNIQTALQNIDQESLNKAFLNLKIFARMRGIIAILLIILFVFGLFGLIVASPRM